MSIRKIVVLTGAGISAESGIATFRDSGGLWENQKVEDVATPEAFERDPVLVWKFYSARKIRAAQARPNAAHLSLARFAREFRGEFTLVTQNVDHLHERAHLGEKVPLPLSMHGTLPRSRCSGCDRLYADPLAYFDEDGHAEITNLPYPPPPEHLDSLPALSAAAIQTDSRRLPLSPCCGTLLRPHIVWFGEVPFHMDEIQQEVRSCDLFVTIGTSGNVYPAAGLLQHAKAAEARTVCLNLEPIPQSRWVDETILGPASRAVPEFFSRLTQDDDSASE